MKKIIYAFMSFLRQIWEDIMLTVVFIVPMMLGFIFHFGVPRIEKWLCEINHTMEVLSPYYVLFDLIIVIATSIMFAYAGVMVMLEEIDNGLAKYLSVTPLGKVGYIISRVGIMSVLACVYSFVVVLILKLSDIDIVILMVSEVISFLLGIMIAFAIIGLAHNKVEGLALSKFSSVLLLGFFAPLFARGMLGYVAAILPTYWMMEFCYHQKVQGIFISALLSLIYIILFYKKFERKIMA